MTVDNSRDPLRVLSGGDPPVHPDPAFAAGLRARLEAAVGLPKGVVMSGTSAAIAELNSPSGVVEPPRPAALPYLAVTDARAAIAWYADALGASLVGEPVVMDDGRIGHAELSLTGGALYLADEFPELGLKAPAPQSVSVSLMVAVTDADAALDRARRHGARVQREPYDAYGSRTAVVIDPFGHRWMLTAPFVGPRIGPIRHGDLGYVSVHTSDAARAAAFYGHVLGWTYDSATHQVTNTRMHTGIFPTAGAHTIFCCYAVEDLQVARATILASGGQVGQPQDREFGTVLDATDPLGTEFAIFQPAMNIPRPELNGAGPGELSYLTHEATDSETFKTFYGRLLSWTFEPGRVTDGWAVAGCQPMSGVAGGAMRSAAVPMWTVTDVDEAVARVLEAGGSVVEAPSRQSYGRSALCTDDQGARFYLGAL